ncbi:MAG TPA: hypothetical protein VJC18_10930 [bacterium]|nr:hypothetical protein [bacterium]
MTATQIMGAAFLASLALDLPGKDELAAAIFMLLAPPYALTFSTKAKETNVGHYELKQTVAGHAYRVWNPATESELRIDPSDQVLEIHLNNKKLGKTVNEAKGQSAREVFTGVMANERESLLSEIQKILSENPQIKAIRLTTPLDPIYFSWAQDFMIDEYHLSENAERKPSRLKQLLASLIHLSSTQLHPITTGRYMRFMVQRTLKALINQPYPMRTYMIPAEKISQITP